MRTIITLAFFALSFLSASAQYGRSVLNLRLSDNAPFSVVIDGQQAGGVNNTTRLANLTAGKHFIQVYRVGGYKGRGRGHGYPANAFSGYVSVAANAETWATVYPEFQRVQVDEIRAFNNRANQCDPTAFEPRRPQHHDACDPVISSNCPPVPAGPFAMNPADFSQLKQTINNAGFENTRLSIFKQALNYNYFTTAQVRELMDLFWFENSKLEVAKIAYPKTIDQNNYYQVNNEFSFSSSVNELGQYIAMR